MEKADGIQLEQEHTKLLHIASPTKCTATPFPSVYLHHRWLTYSHLL